MTLIVALVDVVSEVVICTLVLETYSDSLDLITFFIMLTTFGTAKFVRHNTLNITRQRNAHSVSLQMLHDAVGGRVGRSVGN